MFAWQVLYQLSPLSRQNVQEAEHDLKHLVLLSPSQVLGLQEHPALSPSDFSERSDIGLQIQSLPVWMFCLSQRHILELSSNFIVGLGMDGGGDRAS